MRKTITFLLVLSLIIVNSLDLFALSDYKILTDPVDSTYEGRLDSQTIRSNVSFNDVEADHWARESIIRMSALDLIKGYGGSFRPATSVTKEEGLAFALRAIGHEETSRALGEELAPTIVNDSTTPSLWSLGYLAQALTLGLISEQDYIDVLAVAQETEELIPDDQETEELIPVNEFVRTDPVTRELICEWLLKALNTVNPEAYPIPQVYTQIYKFSDWQQVDIDKIPYVEAALKTGVMSGFTNNTFRPKGGITRAEMAQVLRNLDNIYNTTIGLEKKHGTIGGYIDQQEMRTGSAQLVRNFYIRRDDGKIDIIKYELKSNSSPEPKLKDVIVYIEDQVLGLSSLFEGDQIEYIVKPETNTAMYILKTNPIDIRTVVGYLDYANVETGMLTIRDNAIYSGKEYSYPMIQSMYSVEDSINYIIIDEKKTELLKLPFGSRVELILRNNIVEKIKYLGQQQLMSEIRGIVVENNPDMGYITIIDNDGQQQTKNYYHNQIVVEKQQYYDTDDEVGYINQVFPNFQYDPRSTTIDQLETGDIVYLRLDPSDSTIVTHASASTNYIMRYGKVLQIAHNGANGSTLLMESEDKQTTWLDILPDIFVSQRGKPIQIESVQPGDWIKVLLNQAILEPGYVIESPKEITVDGGEYFITNVLRGQVGSIDPIQNKITLKNYQRLEKAGWGSYQEAQQLDISGRDIEYYFNGTRISLDYVDRHLKRTDGEVYVAMEKSFDSERVKKVTFRSGRDEVLPSDMVIHSDGSGSIRLTANEGDITTDSGTIVWRHGRLCDPQTIMSMDYATVVLNGSNNAAVIEIKDAPDTSGITIARGRIMSIDEGKSFQVQSMAMFIGNRWVYSPVQRIFNIDYNTRFYDATGYVDPDTFVSYGEESKLGQVFTIIVDGTRADMVIDTSPYTASTNQTFALRGTVYDITDSTASIKDVYMYDYISGQWLSIGTSTTVNITVPENGIIIKENNIITPDKLEEGDRIRAITTILPNRIINQSEIAGYMLFVEN